MEKSVLIIDKPKNCYWCPCIDNLQMDNCVAAERQFTSAARIQMDKCMDYRPSWCPLRDLPDYKMDWRSGSDGYESGWNDCLDKVTGGRR